MILAHNRQLRQPIKKPQMTSHLSLEETTNYLIIVPIGMQVLCRKISGVLTGINLCCYRLSFSTNLVIIKRHLAPYCINLNIKQTDEVIVS